MAEPFVSYAVDKLGDLLVEEGKVFKGLRGEVKQLRKELKRMQGFLKDADARQSESETLRNWVVEIRDLAYDVEDILEDFTINVQLRRTQYAGKNIMKRFIYDVRAVIARHMIGWEIKSKQSEISEMRRNLQSYGIIELHNGTRESHTSSSKLWEQRRTYAHIPTPNIMGLEQCTKELVDLLVTEEAKRVMFISGMGGLGKTTLAKEIYNHSKTRQHFSRFAWAYISQQCKTRDVWETIFLQLGNFQNERDVRVMTNDVLLRDVYGILEREKCLIVLDDIWKEETWKELKNAFPPQALGTKLLLTSRKKELAHLIDLNHYLYEPKILDPEQSWDLLRRTAISGRDESEYKIDKRMEELGQKIVKYCNGLPLAITVLGGLLARKTTFMEWDQVYRFCMEKRHGKQYRNEHDEVLDVLALSYDELTFYLKPCFLYLGHFPEDFEIPSRKIVQMWIADGFVTKHETQDNTVDEVAKNYLHELVDRCMVQVARKGSTGGIKSFRIHDMMREMCLLKARHNKFLEIDNLRVRNKDEGSSSFLLEANANSISTGKARRIAITLDENSNLFMPSKYDNPCLRTLLFFQEKECFVHDWKPLVPMFQKFRLLRVLDLEGIEGEPTALPEMIGHLNHLRFLSIRNSSISEVPSSIGNLVCLLTFDMEVATTDFSIPGEIGKMKSLKHLYLPDNCNRKEKKIKLANLNNLETLVNFTEEIFDVEELSSLPKLKKLHLYKPEDCKAFENIFTQGDKKFDSLQSLSMLIGGWFDFIGNLDLEPITSWCPHLRKLKIHYPITSLPSFEHLPLSLTSLCLWESRLKEDPMPTLEKLPYLRKLELTMNSYLGTYMHCSKDGFPQLIELVLVNLYHFAEWNIEKGAMKKLHILQIIGCHVLESLPNGVEFLKSLKVLDARYMSFHFKEKYEQGGEEFYKVKHIDRIQFINCGSCVSETESEQE